MSEQISEEPGEPSRANWRDPASYKSLLALIVPVGPGNGFGAIPITLP